MTDSADRYLLAVDTSGGRLSVALLDGNRLLEEASSELRAGTVLHELIMEVLERRDLRMADVGRLAVARGPGSFTGLRVGLASIAGLSLAAGIPAVGIETTRSVALASGRIGLVAALLDGGQGRVFAALHEVGAGSAEPVEGPLDLDVEAACGLARRAGAAFLRGHPPGEALLVAAGCRPFDQPLAAAVGRLASAAEPDPRTLEALYARLPAIRPPAP